MIGYWGSYSVGNFKSEIERLKKAASDLANGDWNQVVRSRLVGFVDFRERGSAGHIQDRLRWEPYEELI